MLAVRRYIQTQLRSLNLKWAVGAGSNKQIDYFVWTPSGLMSCRQAAAAGWKQLGNDSCLLTPAADCLLWLRDEERLVQVTGWNVDIASGGDTVIPHTTSCCQSCQCPNTIMVLYEPTDNLSHPFTHAAQLTLMWRTNISTMCENWARLPICCGHFSALIISLIMAFLLPVTAA